MGRAFTWLLVLPACSPGGHQLQSPEGLPVPHSDRGIPQRLGNYYLPRTPNRVLGDGNSALVATKVLKRDEDLGLSHGPSPGKEFQ